MGTSGTSIFADDLACDVRDEFRELIGEGHTSAEATRILTDFWSEAIGDLDDGPVFWLALASTQWGLGRLEPTVKKRAIEVIDTGQDLARWDSPSLTSRRAAVLEKLKQQLESPQPPPKKVPKKFRDYCDWKRGEVFAYELKSGGLVLFRVLGHFEGDNVWTEAGTRSPIIEVFDWSGSAIPHSSAIAELPIRVSIRGNSRTILWRMSERDTKLKRFIRLNLTLEPGQEVIIPEEVNRTCGTIFASSFDRDLKTFYEM